MAVKIESRSAGIALAIWFTVALIFGATGAMASLRPPAPQLILLSILGSLWLMFGLSAGFRQWCFRIPITWLISIHLVRFVGFYFLLLYRWGALPFEFAVPAGIGDIVIACGAVILIMYHKLVSANAIWKWNVLGLIDIVFVVVIAAKCGFHNPASMAPLVHPPLSLLPTFFVPLVIFSHVIISSRVRKNL